MEAAVIDADHHFGLLEDSHFAGVVVVVAATVVVVEIVDYNQNKQRLSGLQQFDFEILGALNPWRLALMDYCD
jgi:hypothetical protein